MFSLKVLFTYTNVVRLMLHHICNPRPYVRGDILNPDRDGIAKWFQSTPLREGRPTAECADILLGPVSIHALREGRLAMGRARLAGPRSFNPRPYVRGDR